MTLTRSRLHRAMALAAAAAVVVTPGLAHAKKKTTAPDPCVTIAGSAVYNDPSAGLPGGGGLISPTMDYATTQLGIKDTTSNSPAPLCAGYTYQVKVISVDGSSLGWQTDTTRTPSNVRVDNQGSYVTFTLTPADSSSYLVAYGTTNNYFGSPASCSPELGLNGSVTITSPTGSVTYWPDTNGDPSSTKTLCEPPPGAPPGGYYYG